MKLLKTILILLIFSTSHVFCQTIDEDEPELDLIGQIYGKDTLVDHVLENRAKYQFQFMVTDIFEEDSSFILGKTHDYSEPSWYFYPASMVKLPTALLTLEKLNEINFSVQSILEFNRDFECGNMKFVEQSIRKDVSFEEMIRELIIVSNNTYYNALYHFLTPRRINYELQLRGLEGTKIYKDFSGCEMPWNLRTHGFKLEESIPMKTYHQKESQLELIEFASSYNYDASKLFGSKNEYRGKIVNGPYDFNYNLEYPIKDMHATTARLFFPEFFDEEECWNMRERDKKMLINSMKSYPKELGKKKFLDPKRYPDNLYKYIVHGDGNPKFDDIISYGKMGISYGFVTESTYIHDPKTNRRYILTVAMYVNSNDTVNDGKYEYDELARPFLARFGQLLLDL